MIENYAETEARWDTQAPPVVEDSVVLLSAWTSDEELARQAASLTAVYGNEYDLDMRLRLARSELRAAAMAVAES
ncbi:Uncharacterised protein [Mycobacteroides abscessus subsp. massiliense]|uniref:hypothetical protein n=1 Tax=Mycobacteroides abscessus TaxID=36809 RepID=UPI0009276FE6|nr:hypothetical protein [Mycobacteroides abscessus]SHR63157.1 Uncharacterised protein [Mycobacteroides abscessus subsp. abscessus]SKG49825.1 Uncharacterised protein [Mycobacteroides abscessus subsp. massiliense]SKH01851.1 Uncharacterised protein [Mycobacteroides abscessus subsp. massiliense]SKH98043.1 Uncharacterised protein [Mycobacteroides abscessus subsp. massiliense]SKJ26255.1 Uncharacterised protein [Mycobacteroides abscessus subsp. massiliense]